MVITPVNDPTNPRWEQPRSSNIDETIWQQRGEAFILECERDGTFDDVMIIIDREGNRHEIQSSGRDIWYMKTNGSGASYITKNLLSHFEVRGTELETQAFINYVESEASSSLEDAEMTNLFSQPR